MFLYDCFEGEIRTRIKTESKLLILVICHLESNLPNVTSLSNQRNANYFFKWLAHLFLLVTSDYDV